MKRLIVALIGVGAVAAGWIFFAPSKQAFVLGPQDSTSTSVQTATTTTPQASTPRSVPAGMREYRHPRPAFSLFYPDALAVEVFDEGGGVATISFQNITAAQGFQIFVLPYGQAQITEERFRQDIPSGVRNGEKQITLAGVPAVSFFSTNDLLGETAEVWFIRDGFLFEVTAPKSLAPWLSDILLSWMFLTP